MDGLTNGRIWRADLEVGGVGWNGWNGMKLDGVGWDELLNERNDEWEGKMKMEWLVLIGFDWAGLDRV